MKTLTTKFWKDEGGAIVSAELIIIATILILGLITGLSTLQTAIVNEFVDLAWSLRCLNQSYLFRGFTGCKAVTAGSAFTSNNNFNNCLFVGNDLGIGLGGLGGGFGGGFGGGGIGGGGFVGGGGGGYVGGETSTPAPAVRTPQAQPCPVENCPHDSSCPVHSLPMQAPGAYITPAPR